jgi:hypothetical protein
MNRRLAVATVVVALLAVTAGCFGSGISDDELDEEAEYDWDTEEDVVIDIYEAGGFISDSEYRAVYNVTGQDQLTLYQRGITSDSPVRIRAVQYRSGDGEFVNGSDLDVEYGDESTVVTLPDDSEGQLAFTANAESKQLSQPAYVSGSYRVMLPEGYEAGDFLIGHVSPRGAESQEIDGRTHLVWDDVSSAISVQFYNARNQYFFWGSVAVLSVIALGGYFYYNRQIQQIQKKREELGLNVEQPDEFDDDEPPPGLQ